MKDTIWISQLDRVTKGTVTACGKYGLICIYTFHANEVKWKSKRTNRNSQRRKPGGGWVTKNGIRNNLAQLQSERPNNASTRQTRVRGVAKCHFNSKKKINRFSNEKFKQNILESPLLLFCATSEVRGTNSECKAYGPLEVVRCCGSSLTKGWPSTLDMPLFLKQSQLS